MPSVTTIIPTYNRGQLVCEALESVFAQSRPVDEIIVVDDGSTDNTPELLRRYGNRIRYIEQPNSGAGAARNRGIKEAKGDYIAFLDSDDIWVKEKTKIQMDFFSRHPHLEFVFGDMANFTPTNDNEVPEIKSPEVHNYFTAHSTNLERILDCLITESVIPTPTVVFERACVSRIGFFDEKLKIAEDLDYWLRAARTCRFGFVNTVLAKRRRHDDNLINDWVTMNEALVEVLTRVEKTAPDLPAQTRRLLVDKLYRTHYDLGSFFFKKKDFCNAYAQLRKGGPGEIMKYKWLAKLILSSLLKHIISRSPQS
jgi:glycosyltransferase involved in cell wall biosynthesis